MIKNKEPNKSVKITLKREEILYDIKNYSYIEGDVMPEGNEPTRHYVFDIAEKGNIDRVNRMLALAYAESVEALYPFCKVECSDEEVRDDILVEPAEYVYTLSVPAQFSRTTVNLLSALLHEFMVCRVLADWFSVVKPDSAVNWREKLAGISTQITEGLNSRIGRLRRTQTPF